MTARIPFTLPLAIALIAPIAPIATIVPTARADQDAPAASGADPQPASTPPASTPPASASTSTRAQPPSARPESPSASTGAQPSSARPESQSASTGAQPPSARPESQLARTRAQDDDGEPRLSLPTEADRVAWQRPGFRLGLAFVYGDLVGLGGAPSGRLLGAKLRAGLRLDPSWSLLTSFEYSLASRKGGLGGLRFAGTLDPTWHVTRSLSVALGFGFGGIVESSADRMDASPLPGELETSYTFPDARTPMAACSGVGAAGLARVEWAYVLGPRASGTIALEGIGQWTGCIDDTGRVEPDTGRAIVRRQWWPHAGATLAVGVTWR